MNEIEVIVGYGDVKDTVESYNKKYWHLSEFKLLISNDDEFIIRKYLLKFYRDGDSESIRKVDMLENEITNLSEINLQLQIEIGKLPKFKTEVTLNPDKKVLGWIFLIIGIGLFFVKWFFAFIAIIIGIIFMSNVKQEIKVEDFENREKIQDLKNQISKNDDIIQSLLIEVNESGNTHPNNQIEFQKLLENWASDEAYANSHNTSIKNRLSKEQKEEREKVRCPKCKSTQIAATQRGYKLTSGIYGSTNFRRGCLKCGHKW
jgi:DNA-directed RNA polymerase subunit M/transcription elongation factor TFIIS